MNTPTTDAPARSSKPKPAAAPSDSADAAALQERVEAILISVDRPINAGRIAEALQLGSPKDVHGAIDALNTFYEGHGRAFRVREVAGGYQIHTRPDLHEHIAALHRTKLDHRLSPAALETLAIVAYKQPIIRAEIEAIRGVSSGEMLRSLMDRHLVKIVGRAEEIGRPMLYGTTKTFLQVFGLSSLKDLPKPEEFAQP